MSLAVKRPLTAPGTLAWLRSGIALTVPGALVAWPRWGTRVGIISQPWNITYLDRNFSGSVPALLQF